ncbi:hypothetical protein ABL78_5010 [Leptomonas seymouri]|uniref:Uncharacterized protein n=1 Tax=Leptomonas seymouri TaxID=5684 RepID=A0A0N0P512_LEPSE|nr:hypothetical protein ABL78_5010 [Leptomonas seymouri]|eukprot:KPI85926.1 hypothetical protein ABL78_5010 [Leptomonas seymouri]
MYRNVSRSSSPSSMAVRASKIDLENLEKLQDAWCKKYEMLHDPPPPPQINSPRSLHACAMSSINPQQTLQKLSLKQHLFRVLGNANMLSALPKQCTTEYKVLMQSALRSFQEAAIGLGTSQEKLAAYIAFNNQEELREPLLASLRELRRQLMAEEGFEERKCHHHRRRSASGEVGVSVRRRNSFSMIESSAHSQTSDNSTLRPWKVKESARSRGALATSQPELTSSMAGLLGFPISASPGGTPGDRAPSTPNHDVGVTEMSFTALESDTTLGAASSTGPADFTPALNHSGKLPYTPRDVSMLNSSYFGNRSIQSTVSNPSGAPLPCSSLNNSTLSPTPKRPPLAQTPQQSQQPFSRLPLVPLPPPPPAHSFHKRLSESAGDVDREVSIGSSLQEDLGIESLTTQDTSLASLNGNQLDMLLGPGGAKQAVASLSGARMRTGCAAEEETAKPAVQQFHEDHHNVHSKGAASTSGVSWLKKQAFPDSANFASPKSPFASARADASLTDSAFLPSSRCLTLSGRTGYTNHLNSPSQLVPNMWSCSKRPLLYSSTGGCEQAPMPNDSEARGSAAAPGLRDADVSSLSKAAPANPTAPIHPLPPAITQAEQADGFVYYCANVTRSVTKFYGGAHFPIAEAVSL